MVRVSGPGGSAVFAMRLFAVGGIGAVSMSGMLMVLAPGGAIFRSTIFRSAVFAVFIFALRLMMAGELGLWAGGMMMSVAECSARSMLAIASLRIARRGMVMMSFAGGR